ncbi:MAG: GMC family oxidoreductase [Sedimenticola sp.]|nr:GMC family oxidoreductase [Sedimenticola sp.]
MTPDIIVVGSGMSGAPAAWLLSERGYNVLLIESGADISPAELPTASIDWERKRDSEFNPVAAKRKNLGDYPVDDDQSPIAVCNFNAVGGSSILYSAHFPRFLKPDFTLKSDEDLAVNWPIEYDELLPFFEMNESIVGLAGKVGDTFYPELKQVFNSPVQLGKAGKSLAGGYDQLGWHWWPSYAAINTDQTMKRRLKCHGLGPCNTGCPMGAKATAKNTYLSLGLEKRVILMSEMAVSKLLINDSQVVGVEVVDRDKQVHNILCDKVVLAAGAIGTPRILLNSLNDDNARKIIRKDLIGKNLMMHPLGYAEGYFVDKIDTEKGPQGAMLYSMEFYRPSEPVDFKLGFMMHALRGASPVDTVKSLYGRRKLKFGADIYQQFSENYGHTMGIAIICEDLPDIANKVELDHENLDHLGIPGVKVTYELSNNSKRMMSYGLKKARQVLVSAGAKKTSGFGPIRNTGWHLFGTMCMGSNPKESVVDPNGAVHGLNGAYVFDASVFVTSSCVNPANTIQAVSLYLSDKLDEYIRNAH